jgi:xanthine dehydrogenase accessory factor
MPSQLEFFDRVAALARQGRRFAVATVVGRRAPVSAHLGDHAIVLDDGRMDGFVGGACAREIVRTHALEVLRSGSGRLVSIRPDAADGQPATGERIVVRMTCASEGAVDVYIEPFVQARQLIVVGATPVAAAVARVARSLDYHVVRIVEPGEMADVEPEASAQGARVAPLSALDEVLQSGAANPDRAAVVASQGHYDEETLETILRRGIPYVGLVASRPRGSRVREWLNGRGVPGLASLRNPAGLDLGARSAPEVALSIVAEIVQRGAAAAAAAHGEPQEPKAGSEPPATAIDPVCHMHVTIATAKHTAEVGGIAYYFCCAGCRTRFLEQPGASRPLES